MDPAPQTLNPEILLTHAEFIRALARSLIRDEHKAEDVAQDVWVAALDKPAAEVGSMRAWLAGTARNLVRRTLRTDDRQQRHEAAAAQRAAGEALGSDAGRPTDELIEAENARRHVVDALLQVKEPYRSAILYRYYDDLPPRKISRRLGVPVETVKTRIQRGLDRLRKSLDTEYGGRMAWCLPLSSAAGLKLTGTSSAVLTGALAMSVKAKILVAAALTAFVLGSLIYFRLPGAGDDGGDPHDLALVSLDRLEDPPESEGDASDNAGNDREPVPLPGGAGVMPVSYRRALGGFRGRVIEANGAPVADRGLRFTGVRVADILPVGNSCDGDVPPRIDLKTRQTVTDKKGVFSVDGVHPRAFHLLRVDRAGGGFITRVVDAQPGPGETVDLGDIVLGRCSSLTGQVLDGAGDPVAGARVRAVALPAEAFSDGVHAFREGCLILFELRLFGVTRYVIDPPPAVLQLLRMLPIPETRTGSDGTFRLEEVPVGETRLVVDKKGFVAQALDPVNLSQDKPHDAGAVTLDRGVVIRGKVAAHDGGPAPAIEVTAGAVVGSGTLQILHPPEHTDEEGRFSLEGAMRQPTIFAFRAHSHHAWTFSGPHDPGSELLLRLPPAFDIRLSVVDVRGAAVNDVCIKLRERSFQNIFPSNAPLAIDDRVETLQPGTFVIKGFPPGEYDLVLTAPGYGRAVNKVEVLDESIEKKMTLKPAGKACVQVIVEESGLAVEWAEVFVGREITDWIEQGLKISRGRTDGEGRVSFDLPSPGKYTVTAIHPGYAPCISEIEIPSDAETVLAMKPGGAVDGLVHFPGEIDARRHIVALDYRSGRETPDAETPRLAALNGEGRFRVANLGPGRHDVYLVHRLLDKDPLQLFDSLEKDPLELGSVEIAAGETTTAEFHVDMNPPRVACGLVTGRVMIDGRPASGAVVAVRFRSGKAEVDASGRFDLGVVPVGTNFLSITIPALPDGSPAIRLAREIVVEEGLPLFEEVAISTGSIFGKVLLLPEGKPLCGIRIRAWIPTAQPDYMAAVVDSIGRGDGADQAIARTSRTAPGPFKTSMETSTGVDGSFLFDRVPAGIYTLKVEENRFGCRNAGSVEVLAGDATGPVVVKVFAPVTVKGWVSLPEGARNADQVGLTIYPEGAGPVNFFDAIQQNIASALSREVGGSRFVTLDAVTGAFKVDRMMPGRYEATLSVHFKDRKRPSQEYRFETMEFDVPVGGVKDLHLVPVPRTDNEARTPLEKLKKDLEKLLDK
jgi:RNA polymerase sigma factor (sigma-70 family)